MLLQISKALFLILTSNAVFPLKENAKKITQPNNFFEIAI